MGHSEQTIDPRRFREVCGTYATGVAVVTAVNQVGGPVGVTVNSFTSVSLDPPLVQFCLDRAASVFEIFRATDQFAVNVLARDQQRLSKRFAESGRNGFDGVDYFGSQSGCPILPGCLANMECTRYASYDGGDHVIILGQVRRLACAEAGEPLLFYRGGYGGFV